MQRGSAAIGTDGFQDPLEFGTLRSRDNPDDVVYKDGTGQEYVFKRHDFQGKPLYLIDRMVQPGVEYDRANSTWPTGRRGVSFEWNDPRANASSLDEIIVRG